MINFGGYYYIQESDIEAIEMRQDNDSNAYPFVLTICTRTGKRYQLRYQTKTERDATAADMARTVGVPRYQAVYRLRQLGVHLVHKWGPDKLGQYGAYDRDTTALVAMGSAREVAAQLGITVESLRCHVCRGSGKYQIVRMAEPDGEEAAE